MELKKGDRIHIRRKGGPYWSSAEVISEDGKVTCLMLKGMVRAGDGFIAGALPLFHEEDGRLIGLAGDEYVIERLS